MLEDSLQKLALGVTTCLGKQKSRIMGRIEGIWRNYGTTNHSSSIDQLQRKLWLELEEILIQEDILWAQKAKCMWYSMGDKNTKYFHARANGRRRNKIEAIKNEMDVWTDDGNEINELATNFFIDLFRNDAHGSPTALECNLYPPLEDSCMTDLLREVSSEEIKFAMFSMGALKSPGPDGLNAMFFQSQWETLGSSIARVVRTAFEDPNSIN